MSQDAFAEAVREFAKRECGTREQRDALTNGGREQHSQVITDKLAELGWIGCAFPERYGGAGGTLTDVCVLLDELNFGLVPNYALGITMIATKAVEHFGTEEQRHRIIGEVCRGSVSAVAMSEPGAGSDVGSMTTRAQRVDGGYLINGQKTWISSAHYADRFMLVCRTDRSGPKHQGITMFDVPTNAPGIEIRGIDTLGGREVNDVYFTDCFVPASAVIGAEGAAWKQLMAGLNFERLACAAGFLGHARRTFADTLDFIRTREQFGRPVGSFQALSHRIADLATELECCQLLVYDVARKADENPGKQMPREASMAKLKVTETAKRMALEGMQMMGGLGYTTEFDMERQLRTSVISTVYAGTSEVQRGIIAKAYGL